MTSRLSTFRSWREESDGRMEDPCMYLRNVWYVPPPAPKVTRNPQRIRVLGEDIVVYRATGGASTALEDACPHRKLPLSMGRLKGDNLECGYHGMTFNCSGACVWVPGQDRV